MKDFLNKDIFNEKKPIWLQIFKGYTLIGSVLIFIIANILAIVYAVFMASGLIWFVIFIIGTLLTVINLFVGMLILHFGHHISTISACAKRSLAIQLAEYNRKYNNADDNIDIESEIESSEEFKSDKVNDGKKINSAKVAAKNDMEKANQSAIIDKKDSKSVLKTEPKPKEKIKVESDIDSLISDDDFN